MKEIKIRIELYYDYKISSLAYYQRYKKYIICYFKALDCSKKHNKKKKIFLVRFIFISKIDINLFTYMNEDNHF